MNLKFGVKMIKLSTVIPVVFNKFRTGSTFLSVINYTNEWNEISDFGIVFHVDYMKAVKKAVNIWLGIKPKNNLEKQARIELIDSYSDTLAGKSRSLSAHSYDRIIDGSGQLIRGVKYHNGGMTIHLWGFVVNKKILVPGMYSDDMRGELTLEKNRLLKLTPISNFRQYKLTDGKFKQINVENLTFTQKDLYRTL